MQFIEYCTESAKQDDCMDMLPRGHEVKTLYVGPSLSQESMTLSVIDQALAGCQA
jgi:hypothetical protein